MVDDATLLVVVVVTTLLVVDEVLTDVTVVVRMELEVVFETVVVLLETVPPGPLTFESPVFCRVEGRSG